ncbi:MAG: hypothetical protein JSS02_06870, partial [Planctomycetes bacterium]|nr:hypothetical protein [Planctomycetota bacterium]
GLLKDHPELEEAVSELTAEEALDGGGHLSLVTRDAPLPRGEYTSSLPISASARTVDDTSMRSSNRSAFDFLNPAAPEFIVSLIATEHPQAIALILSFLPPALSAGVVSQLPTEVQIEVVRRLATLEPIHPDVVKDIEQGLRARMQARLQARHDKPQEISPDGISTVAQLLSASDRPTNREILRNLEYENPELVEKIHRQMFEFDDLLQLDDTTLRRLFNQVDPAYWALALKGASEDMKLKIMSKLSRRSANLLVEELQYLGPVRLSDIETAQQQIVDMIRHLDDAAVPHPEVAGLAT